MMTIKQLHQRSRIRLNYIKHDHGFIIKAAIRDSVFAEGEKVLKNGEAGLLVGFPSVISKGSSNHFSLLAFFFIIIIITFHLISVLAFYRMSEYCVTLISPSLLQTYLCSC